MRKWLVARNTQVQKLLSQHISPAGTAEGLDCKAGWQLELLGVWRRAQEEPEWSGIQVGGKGSGPGVDQADRAEWGQLGITQGTNNHYTSPGAQSCIHLRAELKSAASTRLPEARSLWLCVIQNTMNDALGSDVLHLQDNTTPVVDTFTQTQNKQSFCKKALPILLSRWL